MADTVKTPKYVVWKQKISSTDYDIIYPQTDSVNVVHGDGTVAGKIAEFESKFENIGTDLEKKYVTLDTAQMISGAKQFTQPIHVGDEIKNETLLGIDYGGSNIQNKVATTSSTATYTYSFPAKTGTFALTTDLPTVTGSTGVTVSKSGTTYTVKGTLATTTAAGIMSADDKKHLDEMYTLFGTEAGDADTVVNTVREILELFENYEEGTNIVTALDNKVSRSGDSMTGHLSFDMRSKDNDLSYYIAYIGKTYNANLYPHAISFQNNDSTTGSLLSMFGIRDKNNDSIFVDTSVSTFRGAYISIAAGTSDESINFYTFPTTKSGEVAVLTDIPESLPPIGKAGGDLTDSYPNPTIGDKKVTTAKIADGAVTSTQLATNAVTTIKITDKNVTEGKLADGAVTTVKIKDANVTEAKLDTVKSTWVANTDYSTMGVYSIVEVSTKGRVMKGNQLFTIGSTTSMPASVITGAFYLQEIAPSVT